MTRDGKTEREFVVVSSQSADVAFQSFGRCCKHEVFFEDFYNTFQAKSEDIRKMFLDTNMTEQRRLLRAGLLWLIMYARGAPGGKLQHLAETHSRKGYNVNPALYGLWVDALMDTVRKHDPEYTAELETHWRNALRPGIEIIQNGW